ncbi:DUF1521 domain-containing protein [Sphingomonas xinjiangensis]|uniref:DUF1521 domain-containing protein n=1 Tax=Sphingomonas xinjiangensis TaxID=643568 RepID=A0A840YMA8_9SPHN|nr:DUF1521 domain-containing protein [Sphingomonas xinjiangensis]MBB5710896.1 hypothetical protein [Sphingomonas xinjiangensis]
MDLSPVSAGAVGSIGGAGAGDTPVLINALVLLDPIAAPADSAATLPVSADVALFLAPAKDLPAISGPPAFEVKAIAIGSVVLDLSDGYSLTIDEARSAVFVAHGDTGETILVWGNAQIALDGADDARFWGTTTVELGNGTKITMETAQDPAIAGLFRLDKLTVTQAERAMVITGIAETTLGDLAVVQSHEGEALDAATRDGLTIVADLTGSWSDEYGNAVTQTVLNQTAVGRRYGPGKRTLSLREVSGAISSFVAYAQIDSLMLTIGRNLQGAPTRSDNSEVQRALALYAGGSDRLPIA